MVQILLSARADVDLENTVSIIDCTYFNINVKITSVKNVIDWVFPTVGYFSFH